MAFITEVRRDLMKTTSGSWFWLATAFGIPILAVALAIRDGSPEVMAKARAAAETEHRTEAYRAAVKFVQRRWPEAQQVADFDQCVVRQNGAAFMVRLKARGLNSSNGPVAKGLVVEELRLQNGWELNRITEE